MKLYFSDPGSENRTQNWNTQCIKNKVKDINTDSYTLLAKKVVTPRDDVSFLWLFLFHQSARSKDRLFGVIWCFLCMWSPIFYSVVFCQFWRHLMIKWVTGRMCIPKCLWKIIVVNLVEQRWFFSWRYLVVLFCVCQVNIGYSRLSRR